MDGDADNDGDVDGDDFLIWQQNFGLASGATLVIMQRFRAGDWLEAVEEHRITMVFLVPTMLRRILDHKSFDGTDLSSLRAVSYGNAVSRLLQFGDDYAVLPDATVDAPPEVAAPTGDVEELAPTAPSEEEFQALKELIPRLERQVMVLLLPKDEANERNAILEGRAGTGGDEAALFAAELFRMYQRYAEVHGWKVEIIHASETGLGGLKEAICSIGGSDVFARLKFESGVHRVQRVPETETGGRIHTSAATVAVMN